MSAFEQNESKPNESAPKISHHYQAGLDACSAAASATSNRRTEQNKESVFAYKLRPAVWVSANSFGNAGVSLFISRHINSVYALLPI
jgi:hypothetical protein